MTRGGSKGPARQGMRETVAYQTSGDNAKVTFTLSHRLKLKTASSGFFARAREKFPGPSIKSLGGVQKGIPDYPRAWIYPMLPWGAPNTSFPETRLRGQTFMLWWEVYILGWIMYIAVDVPYRWVPPFVSWKELFSSPFERDKVVSRIVSVRENDALTWHWMRSAEATL